MRYLNCFVSTVTILTLASRVEIPAEILEIVRQLSDERLKQELAERQVIKLFIENFISLS